MKPLYASLIPILLAACAPAAPPPGNLLIEGLPITGSIAFARQQGFTRCLDFNAYFRCRRDGISLLGKGPYNGAVDARGPEGESGFRQVILWSEEDQRAVTQVADVLRARGWQLCRTGTADRGDQDVWRLPGAKVRVSIDASYWGKRRLRILPEDGQAQARCW